MPPSSLVDLLEGTNGGLCKTGALLVEVVPAGDSGKGVRFCGEELPVTAPDVAGLR